VSAKPAPRHKAVETSTQETVSMTFSVNTNTNSLAALETLNYTQQSLTRTQNRVSTGLKVATAADDASTFAIAQGQRGDIAGFQAISSSLALGTATLSVALQGAQTISDTLNQIKAKVVQAQDPTQDHNAIQNDIAAFVQQINSTAAAAQFNGVNLINGGANESILSSLNRTGSTVTAAFITVTAQNLTATGLNVNGLNIANATGKLTIGATFVVPADNSTISVTTAAGTKTFEFLATPATTAPTNGTNIVVTTGGTTGQAVANLNSAFAANGIQSSFDAQGNLVLSTTGDITAVGSTTTGLTGTVAAASTAGALNVVETAINSVKSSLSVLGTSSNQVQTQTNFIKTLTDSLIGGVSQLVDADLAAESATLQSLQTKQQLGIQALSIANQGPGAVLSLFR
jgi:flagellin